MRNLYGMVILFLLGVSAVESQPAYWNTVHLANWEHGDIPATGIPWRYITHLIHFAGSTGGAQTNGSPPYFQAPSGYEDAYGQQLHTLSRQNGVKFLLDLGFNQSGQFCAVERASGGIATWAQTVSNYMVQYGYDGADFDLEGGGCYANIANFARALHDSLAIKNPGKKYDLTTSIMMNAYDVTGWHVPEAVAGGWLDQVNGMWYDQCYPETSPLYPSSAHHCWSNDSAMVFQFFNAGVPKNKIGLGYAIQVYTGCNTCYAKFGQQISSMLLNGIVNPAGVQWDNESKARWYSLGGVNLAYEDTLTGYYKADFIKRKGFGGAMGFCLGRGYIPNPPPGWNNNPAAYGIGRALLGNVAPPPVDTVKPVVSLQSLLNGDTLTGIVALTAAASDNIGVTKVEFIVNGSVAFADPVSPYVYSWNTVGLTGPQTVSVKAYDAAGNTAATSPLTVYVRASATGNPGYHRYEYVFPDGWINVYDIDSGHALVKSISVPTTTGTRGVTVSPTGGMLYISYGGDGGTFGNGSLLQYDLINDRIGWNRSYTHGIDSHAMSPDGTTIYMPDGELSSDGKWYVVNTSDGSEKGVITTGGYGPHNTVVSLDGSRVYLGDRDINNAGNDSLYVASTTTFQVIKKAGKFMSGIRPFTINGTETFAFVTITGLLGFQVCNLTTGQVVYTVDLTTMGWSKTTCGSGCASAPSHGISLSPDEKEVYVIDQPNSYVHVFDVSGVSRNIAPTKLADIQLVNAMSGNESGCAYDCLKDGWIHHSLDGRFVYVGDAGDVINTSTRTTVATLPALKNTRKMLEIDWQNGRPIATSSRTGVGYIVSGGAPPAPAPISPANNVTGQATTVTFTWGSSAGATNYRFQLATDNLFANKIVDDTTLVDTTRLAASLSNSTKYYWRVNARNNAAASAYSIVCNFTTTFVVPPAPALLSPANGATNQFPMLSLNWNASAGAASYRLQVSTDPSFSTAVIDQSAITSTSQPVGPLSDSTLYYWRVSATNSAGTSPFSSTWSFMTAPHQQRAYWNTVHFANWEHGDIPVSQIPWQYITHLIHFAGKTLGAQTNGTFPYFQAPSNWEIDGTYHIGDSLRSYGRRYNVKIMVDLGFNQNADFCTVCSLGLTAMQTWASTVAHYMVIWGYDGADFDAEGGGCYPANGGMGKMAQLLHDSLAALNPGKKYDLTVSCMPNKADVIGFGIASGIQYIDQVNPMWYDQCFPETAPLYRSSTHPCWSNDSAVAYAYLSAGIPRNKIGLGYAIQVYDGCSSCIRKWSDLIGYFNPAGVQWDDESKARWFVANGHTVAYEDTLTGYYKADFIKRNGFGGAMGFCLGRGYIASPPAGWNRNPAAYGIGRALVGFVPPPPPSDTVNPMVTLPSPLNGDTVTGIVQLTASASDNVGVARVDFIVNGAVAFSATAPPYAYPWNTAALSGAQTLSAKAYDAAGNSASTPTVTVYVKSLPPGPPAAPTLLSPGDGATNVFTSPTLSWSPSGGALSYRLQVAGDAGFGSMVYDDSTLTATTQLVGPLSAGTTYHWRVCASNTYGNSPFTGSWNCTTTNAPPPDTIPAPAVLRDDFSAPNGPLPGRSRWASIVNSPMNGSMDIVSSAIQPTVNGANLNFGGVVWDTLMGAGTEASLTLRQKSGNSTYTSLFIYGRMNTKDFNTGTGYRLRFFEQPGTDQFEIQRVGPGYAVSTSLVTAYHEVNVGDEITFRVLSDNQTMEGFVNGTKVISVTDSTYASAQWYFAFRACVFPTPVRYDNFAVSTRKPATLASPLLLSPPKDAAGQSVNPGFSWNPVAGALSYRFQLSIDSAFASTLVDDSTLTAPSDSVQSLANGARYFWRVGAVNSAGVGPYAGPWGFTTVSGSAVLVVNRRTINFGKVKIGLTKKDSVLIRNSGNSPLRVRSIQSSSPLFQPSPATTILQPAGQQNVYVTFTPQQRTTANGLIVTVCDTSGLTDTVFVSGRGAASPRGSASPGIIVFGPVQPGTSVTGNVTISNAGDFDLLISDIQSTNPNFKMAPKNVVIAPAESVHFLVTATPTTSQLETAQFIFIDNSGSSSDTLTAQIGSPTGVGPGNGPDEYALLQNYPNPFNPQTYIRYTIPVPSKVLLRIYNVLGEEIVTLVNDIEDPGVRSVVWNGTDRRGLIVATGVYFYRLEATGLQKPDRTYIGHQRMIFAK